MENMGAYIVRKRAQLVMTTCIVTGLKSSRPRTQVSLLKNAEDAARKAITVSIGYVTE